MLAGLVAELPEINDKLPHKVDEQTTFMSINYADNQIINSYRLNLEDVSPQFVGKIQPMIKKQFCDDAVKRNFLNEKFTSV